MWDRFSKPLTVIVGTATSVIASAVPFRGGLGSLPACQMIPQASAALRDCAKNPSRAPDLIIIPAVIND